MPLRRAQRKHKPHARLALTRHWVLSIIIVPRRRASVPPPTPAARPRAPGCRRGANTLTPARQSMLPLRGEILEHTDGARIDVASIPS
jgi:hypothetical protein